MITPKELLGKASLAIVATRAESIPPLIPMITPLLPVFSTSPFNQSTK
jgi:hypothetical protein